MASTTFYIDQYTGDNTRVEGKLEDVTEGVRVTLTVVPDPVTGYVGDLEGVVFHIVDEDLISSLQITGNVRGTPVLGPANSVLNLSGGVNWNGEGQTGFDFGFLLGDQGGNTSLTETVFVISSTQKILTVDDFVGANPGPNANDIGIRLKTVIDS